MADRLTAQSGAATSRPDGHAAQAGSVNRGVGRLTAQTGIARWGQGRLAGSGIAHRGDTGGGGGVGGGQIATQRGAANSGTEAQPETGLRVWGGRRLTSQTGIGRRGRDSFTAQPAGVALLQNGGRVDLRNKLGQRSTPKPIVDREAPAHPDAQKSTAIEPTSHRQTSSRDRSNCAQAVQEKYEGSTPTSKLFAGPHKLTPRLLYLRETKAQHPD